MSVTVRTAALAAVALALAPLAARAADIKLGYVDLQRALEEIDEGKAAKAQLKKDFDEKQKQLDQRTDEVKRLDADFQKQAMVMAPDAKAAKAAEIERKKVEVQQFFVGAAAGPGRPGARGDPRHLRQDARGWSASWPRPRASPWCSTATPCSTRRPRSTSPTSWSASTTPASAPARRTRRPPRRRTRRRRPRRTPPRPPAPAKK